MRRSSRKAAAVAKQRTRQIQELENASDLLGKTRVLQTALPPKKDNYDELRLRATGRSEMGLLKPKKQHVVPIPAVGSYARKILFLNLGDETILAAARGERRPWMRGISKAIIRKNGKLFLQEDGQIREFALQHTKRREVKALYYNPKKPSTIQPITDELRVKYCNISRKNVRNILRSLETYQLMFPRRLPPKISNKTLYTQPGIIAADTFFPSENSGWKRSNVLVMMDVWSRFSRAYIIAKKDAELFGKAMTKFMQEFTSLGHLPRRLLTDKGSELVAGESVMEVYRQKRDGQKPLHLRSFTGTPVQVVENMNSQYQRRLEIYRISDLHDDPQQLLVDISDQLNNQRRKRRGNLTPYELLALKKKQRDILNRTYENTSDIGISGQRQLPLLKVGDRVRRLMMTFKEQISGSRKGFQEKWSRKIFEVLGIHALRRNKFAKKYRIGDPKRTYYRHELLLIPDKVDQEVIRFPTTKGQVLGEDIWEP